MPLLRRLKRLAMASLPGRFVPALAARVALWSDEVELHLLDVLCDRSRASVDVGANIGVYAYLLSRRSSRVLAVEPHPALAGLVRAGLPRSATVLEAALSDRSGRGVIRVPVVRGVEVDTRSSLEPGAGGAGQTRLVEVELRPLELSVLRGGRGLLQRDKPRVLVEVEERHKPGTTQGVFRFMRDLGYEGCFVAGSAILPVSEFSVHDHQAGAGIEPLEERATDAYVRNFLFLPGDDWDTVVPALRNRLGNLGLASRATAVIRA